METFWRNERIHIGKGDSYHKIPFLCPKTMLEGIPETSLLRSVLIATSVASNTSVILEL